MPVLGRAAIYTNGRNFYREEIRPDVRGDAGSRHGK